MSVESLYQIVSPWFPLLAVITLIIAIISISALPWLLLKIPTDYFIYPRRPKRVRSLPNKLIWLLRNTVAFLLLAAGLLMLVLPGQGLLTILVAITMSSFPGKYHLSRAIVRRQSVFKTANWIRAHYHQKPLIHPDSTYHQG